MNFAQLIRNAKQRHQRALAARAVRRIVESLGLSHANDGIIWNAAAERRDTYRVSLHAWAEETSIHFLVASQLVVERELIPRELLLVLLEENHHCVDGSFQLVPKGIDRYVVLGRIVDSRFMTEAEMKALAERLIATMQKMITRLYARELIISGPETAERARDHA